MATGFVVLTALLAALCFAVAAVLQQEAAGAEPGAESLRPRLLLRLARRPLWLAGIAVAALSYGIQGAALAFGPLVLVQPLAATDLLFALPLVAWRHRMLLTRTDAVGAVCTAAGVAAFLAVLPSPGPARVPPASAWLPPAAAATALAAVLVAAGLRGGGRARTLL
ncbi:DMT family transporter [Streptacidiphilus sp. ASG 303]|uniref:DMT family transporter n=1 Tax=Streptacidiphilus sp. ASG 303 TaxID=2896847 RepID=UPI001E578545|nr:DMT family transporter [Streptacidiphilus sp. ASG 303]MCD0486025.1 DMT family transporter [Streptacidiphilus sp. ASG 303]